MLMCSELPGREGGRWARQSGRQAGRQRNETGKAGCRQTGRQARQAGRVEGRQAVGHEGLPGRTLAAESPPARPWTVPVEMASEERWG